MYFVPRFKERKMLQDCEVRFSVPYVFLLAFADPSTKCNHRISLYSGPAGPRAAGEGRLRGICPIYAK